MTEEKILLYVLGIALSIITFFLKGVLSRLNSVEMKANSNETKIQVMEANHHGLDRRMDDVNESVKALTNKIDVLLIKMNQ